MLFNANKTYLTVAVTAALSLGTITSANAATLSIDSAKDWGNGHASYPASNTIDGSLDWASRWAASGTPVNLELDLGSAQSVGAVGISWGKGGERTHSFEIWARASTSDAWTKVRQKGDSTGNTSSIESYDIDDIEARYVRIKTHSNSDGTTWTNIKEVEVYGAGSTGGATAVPALIQAEDYVGFADTTSGNTGGQYRSDDVDVQVTTDTDGGYNVGWIKSGEYLEYPISVSSAGNYVADIRVASSKSTGAFNVLVDGAVEDAVSVGNTGGWQSWTTKTVDLGNLSAGEHTIRIDVTGSDFNFNWIDVKKGSGEVGGDFDWMGWKTTLPVNGDTWYNDGNTESAAEIQPAGCTDDTFDENLNIDYFWSDSEGLHFKVPMNLDGKTPGTQYIRSELRELHNWSPCGTTSQANWSYGGDHELKATVRIDDYDQSVTPKVVVGQIHGADIKYATIKLHWEGDSKPIRVIYNETPSSSTPENVYLGYVDSSTFWDYSIKMTDTGITLSAGGVTETITFGNELSNDWKDADFYFKAGLYPQHEADASSTEAYEATFSTVTVSH